MGVNSMADIAGLLGASDINTPKNSTSRKNNTDLSMEDFLTLMVVQLQNQTMDDTMDTSEMMNQMVQMQMITAITNMNETNIMSYASSLVGKVVTIGIVNGDTLEEREIQVIGTGVLNGQQVIFGSDGETYGLNQIMAVGHLPEIKDSDETGDGTDKPVDGTDKPIEGGSETGEGTTDPSVDGSNGTGDGTEYGGEQGAPTDE